MSASRILLAAAVVACVAWLIYNGGGGREAEEAERIARKMAKLDAAQPVDSVHVAMVRLSDKLIAERSSDLWEIESPSGSRISLPYRPDLGPQRATSDPAKQEDANPGFVGAAACADCHQQQHDGFVQTAHHKTSAPASEKTFHGPIDDASIVRTSDPELSHRVIKRGDSLHQSIDFCDWKHQVPMQIVTGSAKTGQTYLYWHGDRLFQTHISYFSGTDEWIPSPGFSPTDVNLTRVIRTGCLECHATFIQQTKPPNHYLQDSAIWGISCERCHGPGQSHIEFHQQNPETKQTKFITLPAKLSRQQQLDICGQCHSGSFQLKKPAFSFRPGDEISEFHQQIPLPDKVGSVHTSNQLTRLKKSSCFQHSDMTCTSCHNPHRNERRDTATFSGRCLECHDQQHCGMSAQIGDSIVSNCISCHMPMTRDQEMPLETRRGMVFPSMVDHHVRIDLEATKMYVNAAD